MPRILKSPSAGSTYVNPVILAQGGSGEITAPEALAALGGITPDMIGTPNGVLGLNLDGSVNPIHFAGLTLTDIGIDGDTTILPNQTKEYFITTYDSYANYEVNTTYGSVIHDKNVITYTASSDPGLGGFTINGRVVNIQIMGATIVRPSIILPISGSMDAAESVVIEASAYYDFDQAITHHSTDWELATDVLFSNIVQQSLSDQVNMTNWTVSGLTKGNKYYARVKFRGLVA